jgi:hypothetical protein
MILPSDVYRKYNAGDPISDEELDVGIAHFGPLTDLLYKSGPEFKLAGREAQLVLHGLQGYKKSREEDRLRWRRTKGEPK